MRNYTILKLWYFGTLVLRMFDGGGGEIRTHGRLPYNDFQDRRLQPLGHPSSDNSNQQIVVSKNNNNYTRKKSSLFPFTINLYMAPKCRIWYLSGFFADSPIRMFLILRGKSLGVPILSGRE